MESIPPPPREESLADRFVRLVAGPPGWLASAPVTRVVIWLNVFVFAGEIAMTQRLGALTPRVLLGLPDRVLLAFGANYSLATVLERRSEALVASCFAHGSLLHIALNMFALRNIGPLVESQAGSERFAPTYLASGIAGSMASALIGWLDVSAQGERLSVGASGALFGVMGAALVVGWRLEGFRAPHTQTMLHWIVVFLAVGFLASLAQIPLDNAAHVAGLAVGIGAAMLWKRGYVYTPRARQIVFSACSAVLVATVVTLVLRDLVSPYATLRAEERVLAARDALDMGECREARRGLNAAARLWPRRAEVAALRIAVEARCARP